MTLVKFLHCDARYFKGNLKGKLNETCHNIFEQFSMHFYILSNYESGRWTVGLKRFLEVICTLQRELLSQVGGFNFCDFENLYIFLTDKKIKRSIVQGLREGYTISIVEKQRKKFLLISKEETKLTDWQLIMIFLASTTTHIVHNKQHKHLRSSKIFCLGYESLTKDSSHKVYDISRKSAECHQ
ncbi:hypothetical protein GQX74_002156 [Glossina fuscipes]|nr:hypothetical protein GQX74_002156 [Glossina fuscipes]